MEKKLVEMLHLEFEPVWIFFANTEAKCDLEKSCLTTHSWRTIEIDYKNRDNWVTI